MESTQEKQLRDALARLDEKYHRRDELQRDLKRSLAIQFLWPEAFSLGAIKTHISGNHRDPKTLRVTYVRPDGESKTFRPDELPRSLFDGMIDIIRPHIESDCAGRDDEKREIASRINYLYRLWKQA